MRRHPDFHSDRRGSALILVLWCLILLGMAVFGVIAMVELSVEHTSHAEAALQARALALSGVALGFEPRLFKDDPLLSQQVGPGRRFDVRIQSEGARLNLNYVLQTNHREILVNLFHNWGMPLDAADRAADCLYDWVTPGDLRSLDGAKANDYAQANLPQRPTGQPFMSLDEVAQVMGMDAVQKAKPNWQDSFTLWSNGPLNINEAPADLIAAVFSLDPGRALLFTQARDGRDGIAGTADDVPVPNAITLESDLGLSVPEIRAVGNEMAFGDPNRRVESVGQANGMRVMISVVARLNISPIRYLLWSEP